MNIEKIISLLEELKCYSEKKWQHRSEVLFDEIKKELSSNEKKLNFENAIEKKFGEMMNFNDKIPVEPQKCLCIHALDGLDDQGKPIKNYSLAEMIKMAKQSEYGCVWYSEKGPIQITKEGKLEPI